MRMESTAKRKIAAFLYAMIFLCPLPFSSSFAFSISNNIGDVSSEGGDIKIDQSVHVDSIYIYYDGYWREVDPKKHDISSDAFAHFESATVRGWTAGEGYHYVLFGKYRQETSDEPIAWRVLTVRDGKALLLSEQVLDTMSFDSFSNQWNNSDICKWLNSDFLHTAFTSTELNAIVYDTHIGSNIFLLSKAEMTNTAYGFSSNIDRLDGNRIAFPSMRAIDKNIWVSDVGSCSYYLRSTPNASNVDMMRSDGSLGVARIDRDNVGVRPAVWVDIEMIGLTKGNGSLETPFQ